MKSGLENLKVTTTVVSTGDEALKLLDKLRGVLCFVVDAVGSLVHCSAVLR